MDTAMEHSDRLRIDAGPAGRLLLRGELDREAGELLRERVTQALNDTAPGTLELDASEVSFLDSSGVRCLLSCHRAAQAAGRRLVVVDPTPIAYQVLEITGLLEHLSIERQTSQSIHPSRPGSGPPRPA